MDEYYIPYEQALELKELGFNEPCISAYHTKEKLCIYSEVGYKNLQNNHFPTAPLYQQAFRWFREKFNLIGHVRESWSFNDKMEYVTQINGVYVNHGLEDKPVNRFSTYEEAELACLKKLIEIVKERSI